MRVVIKDRRKWKIVAVIALLCGAYLAYRHYVFITLFHQRTSDSFGRRLRNPLSSDR
jgi:hypothetical protein